MSLLRISNSFRDCNLFFGLWCAVALLGVVRTRS